MDVLARAPRGVADVLVDRGCGVPADVHRALVRPADVLVPSLRGARHRLERGSHVPRELLVRVRDAVGGGGAHVGVRGAHCLSGVRDVVHGPAHVVARGRAHVGVRGAHGLRGVRDVPDGGGDHFLLAFLRRRVVRGSLGHGLGDVVGDRAVDGARGVHGLGDVVMHGARDVAVHGARGVHGVRDVVVHGPGDGAVYATQVLVHVVHDAGGAAVLGVGEVVVRARGARERGEREARENARGDGRRGAHGGRGAGTRSDAERGSKARGRGGSRSAFGSDETNASATPIVRTVRRSRRGSEHARADRTGRPRLEPQVRGLERSGDEPSRARDARGRRRSEARFLLQKFASFLDTCERFIGRPPTHLL